MAVQDDWVPVDQAAELAGCSPQFIRRELDQHLDRETGRTTGGRLNGWKVTGKSWLVLKASAIAMRETLSSRARIHEGKRAAKKVAKKAPRRKR